jgi:hypothetical protein
VDPLFRWLAGAFVAPAQDGRGIEPSQPLLDPVRIVGIGRHRVAGRIEAGDPPLSPHLVVQQPCAGDAGVEDGNLGWRQPLGEDVGPALVAIDAGAVAVAVAVAVGDRIAQRNLGCELFQRPERRRTEKKATLKSMCPADFERHLSAD